MRSQCRIRHLQPLVDCTIFRLDDQNSITVCFDIPIRGITRGQMAVFYALNGLVCLGGGSIAARGETYFEQNRQLPSTLHPAGLNDLSLFRRAASA